MYVPAVPAVARSIESAFATMRPTVPMTSIDCPVRVKPVPAIRSPAREKTENVNGVVSTTIVPAVIRMNEALALIVPSDTKTKSPVATSVVGAPSKSADLAQDPDATT